MNEQNEQNLVLPVLGCAGSLLLGGLFFSCFSYRVSSLVREWGLLSSYGAGASHCSGFSCCRAGALGCVGFQSAWLPGSRAQTQQLRHMGLICCAAREIFPQQGLNLCVPHEPADSPPLSYQGIPEPDSKLCCFCGKGVICQPVLIVTVNLQAAHWRSLCGW